jgi:hypothetical protein
VPERRPRRTPLPLVVPAEKLRTALGIRSVVFTQGKEQLAITDRPLEHFQEKWTPVFRQKMRPLKKK